MRAFAALLLVAACGSPEIAAPERATAVAGETCDWCPGARVIDRGGTTETCYCPRSDRNVVFTVDPAPGCAHIQCEFDAWCRGVQPDCPP